MSKLDDDLKVPYISAELVEYLKIVFNPNSLLDHQASSAEALVGYMQKNQIVRLQVAQMIPLIRRKVDNN